MEPKLLEKYWNGETSLEEEAQIMKEMADTDTPEASYFAMIAAARNQKSRLSFKDLHLQNTPSAPVTSPRVMPLYRLLASAAAILMFAIAGIGLWNYTQTVTQPVQMAETFDDPYEAYEEVREALAFVSSKLNKSQSEAMHNIQKAGQYAEMFK
jgi:hypothetical protein